MLQDIMYTYPFLFFNCCNPVLEPGAEPDIINIRGLEEVRVILQELYFNFFVSLYDLAS